MFRLQVICLLLCVSLVGCQWDLDRLKNAPLVPSANFTIQNDNCEAPCTISFINQSQNADRFFWNFGDGATSTDDSPSHTYDAPGMYEVRLAAFAGDTEAETTLTVTILEANPPMASFEVDSSSNNGYAPSTFIFRNTSTNANEFRWDFGDPTSGDQNRSNQPNPSHRFSNPGNYDVVLTAKNSANAQEDIYTQRVTVLEVITFMRTYDGGNGDDDGRSIIETEEGEFFIVGDSHNGTNTDAWLIRTDARGMVFSGFPKKYDDGNYEFATSIIETHDGNLAFVGQIDRFSNADIWMILSDKNGNSLSGSPFRIDLGEGDIGREIIETRNQDLAIIGSAEVGQSADVAFIRVGFDGVLLPGFPKFFHERWSEFGQSLTEIRQVGFALCGSASSNTSSAIPSDFWLILTDPNGNELSHSPRRFDGLDRDDRPNAIIQLQDERLAIAGRSRNPTSFDGWFIITDTEGNPEPGFPKRLDYGQDEYLLDIIETRTGDLAMVGYTDNEVNWDLWFVLTDANGNVYPGFPKSFDNGGNEIGNAIIQTLDGGFAIVGYTDALGDQDLWFIKTDSQGIVN